MPTVYLSLGTNLGDRLANLSAALAALPDIVACSSVYETEPWGVVDQPRFLNMCCRLRSDLPAAALHARLKAIERELGRTPSIQWGPRLIDIDLLTYDGLVIQTESLTVPHPRIAERAFVLMPLAELDPNLHIPGLQGTVAEQLAALPDPQRQAWWFSPAPVRPL
jgi:2-amino-4-hydroxy-6-hydroxymethyldihydropteridine diphosphokinase